MCAHVYSAIHILKCHGKGSMESHLVNGFALAGSRAAQGMPSVVKNAKIALLDFSLQRHKLQMGVQVVVNDVKEVDLIRQREMDITKERIQKILEAGANVILTTKGIDDLAMKVRALPHQFCVSSRRLTYHMHALPQPHSILSKLIRLQYVVSRRKIWSVLPKLPEDK